MEKISPMQVKYYECHITVEPVFEARLEEFAKLCSVEGFKPAKLLMQKRAFDTPTRSTKDTFCTGHGKTFEDMSTRMLRLLASLREAKFVLYRHKIEAVILDERAP